MRAVVQRVLNADVHVEGACAGQIDRGLAVLLALAPDDTAADRDWMIGRLLALRLFDDAAGRMVLDVAAAGGALLIVSQFTLLASTRKGTKPSWHRAAPPDAARVLYDDFITHLRRATACPVEAGVFAGDMQVALVNDGPVTLVLDSRLRE